MHPSLLCCVVFSGLPPLGKQFVLSLRRVLGYARDIMEDKSGIALPATYCSGIGRREEKGTSRTNSSQLSPAGSRFFEKRRKDIVRKMARTTTTAKQTTWASMMLLVVRSKAGGSAWERVSPLAAALSAHGVAVVAHCGAKRSEREWRLEEQAGPGTTRSGATSSRETYANNSQTAFSANKEKIVVSICYSIAKRQSDFPKYTYHTQLEEILGVGDEVRELPTISHISSTWAAKMGQLRVLQERNT
eukprot:GCRY01008390.1.p1 GENE.GCRY01008390.1~~GCRY01008390.1.p1  ORF type:complete len:246 (-),score=22.17 GCRY01008390.1:338-1075(-)